MGLGSLIGLFFLIIIVLIIFRSSIRTIKEYERAIIFRLGRLMGAKGPGLIVVLPIIDKARTVDLRVMTLDVPKQQIITRDNVTVDVDAVVYLRVFDPVAAVMHVQDYIDATAYLSQTTLRDIVGQVEFDDLLSRREEINKRIQGILDEETDSWGIKVTTVAIKDVSIPESMQRAIAKQAEAEREKRSRIIMAAGELAAAEKMTQAAVFYSKNPIALRLRELQTWVEISREKNMIVVTDSGGQSLGTLLAIAKGEKDK